MGMDHLVFIPGMLLVGLVLGYILGQKAAVADMARKKRRLKE